MKKARKFFSVLLTLALLVSMVPAAFAATDNTVTKVITVDDDFEGLLSILTLEEDSPGNNDFVSGDSFVVTLPDGVEFATGSSVVSRGDNAIAKGFVTGAVSKAEFSNSRVMNVVIAADTGGTTAEKITINFGVKLTSYTGDITATIDPLDSGVTGGDIIIGRAGGNGTQTTVLSTETIGEGSSEKLGIIRISEIAKRNFTSGDVITLTLPSDFDWDVANTQVYALGGFTGLTFTKNVSSNNNSKLEITVPDVSAATSKGIIEIVPYVNVNNGADYGEIEVDVEGDNVDDATVVIGEYADYEVSVEAKSVEEVTAGAAEQELGKIVIDEGVAGSLLGGRKLTVVLPEGAKFATGYEPKLTLKEGRDVRGSNTMTVDSEDRNEAYMTIAFATGDPAKFEIELKKINLDATMVGDIEVKVEGSSGAEGEVVVAKAVAPVTVEAVQKEVRLGVQEQVAGDIIIKESKDGAIQVDDILNGKDAEIVIAAADNGVKFAKTPTVEVVEGNLEIGNVSKDGGTLTIKIDSESSRASTIKISDVVLTLDRTVPVGGIEFEVKGASIFETYDEDATQKNEYFDTDSVVSVYPAVVVNAAPETGSVVFNIGSPVYTANGVMKVMDVAPYIKDGRTYTPMRYLAQAIGAEVDWDSTTQTVTLTKGENVAVFTIGSTTYTVNGDTLQADVAPEIANGNRTMLPARFVAEAFGFNVGYVNGQVVVSQ